LWAAGAAAQERRDLSDRRDSAGRPRPVADPLPGTATGITAPMLPGMEAVEEMVADIWATGLSPDSHPVQFARDFLTRIGAVSVAGLRDVEHARRVLVGGVVTHRQRPATAGGVTFINLEDETGMLNVTCSQGVWQRYRRVARTSSALVVRGILERVEGVLNLRADQIAPLKLAVRPASRDFR
jgi:error-prone DNA polymerase